MTRSRWRGLGKVQQRVLLVLLKHPAQLVALPDLVWPEPPDLGPYQTPNLYSTARTAVKALRRRGLVETTSGRGVVVTLTAEGRAMAEELKGEIENV